MVYKAMVEAFSTVVYMAGRSLSHSYYFHGFYKAMVEAFSSVVYMAMVEVSATLLFSW